MIGATGAPGAQGQAGSAGATGAQGPAGSAGAIVAVSDYARNFATYNLTISANGSEKIGGEYYLKQDGKVIGTTKEIGPGTGFPFDYYADQAYEMVTWASSITSPISSIGYGGNGTQYRGYSGWQGYTFAQITTLYNILWPSISIFPSLCNFSMSDLERLRVEPSPSFKRCLDCQSCMLNFLAMYCF